LSYVPPVKKQDGKPATVFYLYPRLAGFYLFYFATLGVILPYWSLYLQSLGFGPTRIGQLMAILLATKVVAPNVWGWIADVSGKRMGIVRIACLAATVSFTGVYWSPHSFATLALVMVSFSFFWNAALPQFEATTLSHLQDRAHLYSSIRLWGSVGFIIMVFVMGFFVEGFGLAMLPTVVLVLFAGLWLVSLTVPEPGGVVVSSHREPMGAVLRDPRVITFFLVCFLAQASHGPYYAFFSIYLEDLGYEPGLIGALWGLGVVAEIGVFTLMHRLLPRFGPRRLMLLALVLTSLRWLLIGNYADHLSLLLFAQVFHAFSFGVYHAVAIHLVHRFFAGAHQGRGQALYSSVSFGAGGGLGNLAAGYLWVWFGPQWTYTLAAVLSVVGFTIAWRGLRI
jgi:PPP family 3-phenylpropionic acid transporter